MINGQNPITTYNIITKKNKEFVKNITKNIDK